MWVVWLLIAGGVIVISIKIAVVVYGAALGVIANLLVALDHLFGGWTFVEPEVSWALVGFLVGAVVHFAIWEAPRLSRPGLRVLLLLVGCGFLVVTPFFGPQSRDLFRDKLSFGARSISTQIERHTNEAEVHNMLGVDLANKGDWHNAASHFRAAISLRGDYAAAHRNLGFALVSKRDFNGAISELREANRLDSTNARGHQFLGIALQKKSDLEGAVAEFRAAHKLAPNDKQIKEQLDKAVALFEERRTTEAANAANEKNKRDTSKTSGGITDSLPDTGPQTASQSPAHAELKGSSGKSRRIMDELPGRRSAAALPENKRTSEVIGADRQKKEPGVSMAGKGPSLAAQKKVRTTQEVVVFADSAPTNAKVVEILDKGVLLTVLNKTGIWYEVQTPSGRTGWIYYEEVVDDVSSTSDSSRKATEQSAISSQARSEEKSREDVRGVGSVSKIKNEILAWAVAENRARADLAHHLESYAAPVLLYFKADKSEHSVAGAGGVASAEKEVNERIRQATRRVASRIAASARVVERRKDRGQYSVSVAIGLREARREFDEAEELQWPRLVGQKESLGSK